MLRFLFLPWLCPTLALLVAGSSFPARAAHAQGTPASPPPAVSERDQQARALFEQGREAYSDGRYRDAWANFHDAYQLSGRPELLFNIGQTADRLGQTSDAIKAFSMYIDRLPAAPNRKEVESRVQALRERLDAQQPTAAAARAPATQTQPRPAATPAAKQPLPTPPVIEPRHKEPRSGFFLHGALGLGYRSNAINRTTSNIAENTEDFHAHSGGFGFALDLSLGYGVLPGFAVGGGVFLDWASSPSFSRDGVPDSKLASSRLTTIGPFVDWYPLRKTLGLYVMAGAGLAVLNYRNAANNPNGIDGNGYGFSLQLGTGYELNLSTSVGLGVELRFLVSALAEAVSGTTTSDVVASPSLLASLTWF